MNELEQEFQDEAESLGYVVLRRGWPDFLIVKDGVVQGVEVKGPNDYVTNAQSAMMNALANGGIDCWVYRGEWKHPDIVKEALQEDITDQIMRNYEWRLRRVRSEIKRVKDDMLQFVDRGWRYTQQRREIRSHIAHLFDTIIEITEEQPSRTTLRLVQKWQRLKRSQD